MSSRNTVRGFILLFITVTIWGTAFVAQSVVTDYMGSFTFNMSRSVLGGLFLLPVIAVMQHRKSDTAKKNEQTPDSVKADRVTLLKGGVSCGICFFIASNLQQLGIEYTSVGKAGFITAMYIIFVPLFSIFLHKKAGIKLWISVVMSAIGLYFLSMAGKESFTVEKGDFLLILCAIGFTFHILVIDYFSEKVDGVKLSCAQFWTAAVLGLIITLIFEDPSWDIIIRAWKPICYAGIMSCGVAYTFQILAQKDLKPTVASLIMSLESVIAAIAGWVILGEIMSGREIFGCALMFAAIIIAQLPEKRKTAYIISK